ncbi:hypothetical protein KAR91_27345 [Candidatus Pacearchaeota archaeon]|nr:hypothetical protein [Candidatus Pacearchaeota archaeon]
MKSTYRRAIDHKWEQLIVKHWRELQISWFGRVIHFGLPPKNEDWPHEDGSERPENE